MKSFEECLEDLANAIIVQAVRDYRDAAYKLKKNPKYGEAIKTKIETERFFKSKWFCGLTDIDGNRLLRKWEEE